jgi:hypothetical protein
MSQNIPFGGVIVAPIAPDTESSAAICAQPTLEAAGAATATEASFVRSENLGLLEMLRG